MMKIVIMALMFFLPFVGIVGNGNHVKKSDDGIIFTVDKHLKPVKNKSVYGSTRYLDDPQIIAVSINDEQNLKHLGKDAFYQCVVQAYANHQSITISPDMIWLLISQGFCRYVNAHAEELRPMLVGHAGQKELEIELFKDLLNEQGEWDVLVDSFAYKIGQYTKDGIAETITADFTTTGPSERIASQITLMESLRTYFDYTIVYAGCGIPSISLKGTPDDWRRVLDKALKLERYGLGNWVGQLKPVIKEFIVAAEGYPNKTFWQQIVKKKRVGKFKGGLCNPEKPTKIDGWLLTLYPDNEGKVSTIVPFTRSMPADMVYVSFEYRIIDPKTRETMKKIPLELWSGFLGIEEDGYNNMLIPKIGWFVCFEGEK